jgi:hypothetical protein
MSDDLSFSFPYSATEHADAIAEQMGGVRFLLFDLLFLIPAGFFSIVFNDVPLVFTLVTLGLLLVVTLPIPAVMHRWQKRKFARDNTDQIGKLQTRTFSRDGFRPTVAWRQPIPWEKVLLITETKRFVMIYGSSDGPFFIPKQAMPPDELERLRTFLRIQFADQPRRLKLQRSQGSSRTTTDLSFAAGDDDRS